MFWAASLQAVWFWRAHFQIEQFRAEDAPKEAAAWNWQKSKTRFWDKERNIFVDAYSYDFYYPADSEWCASKIRQHLNDDEVVTITHWRFPNFWWGHLYRPEVWMCALLTMILIFKVTNVLFRRRLTRVVVDKNSG